MEAHPELPVETAGAGKAQEADAAVGFAAEVQGAAADSVAEVQAADPGASGRAVVARITGPGKTTTTAGATSSASSEGPGAWPKFQREGADFLSVHLRSSGTVPGGSE